MTCAKIKKTLRMPLSNFSRVALEGEIKLKITLLNINHNPLFMLLSSVRAEDQIKFLNLDEQTCDKLDTNKYPVGVEFYLTSSNGDFNTHANEEFITLLDNNRLDYKLDVSYKSILYFISIIQLKKMFFVLI